MKENWKDIETIKKVIIDVSPTSREEAVRSMEILRRVEKKIGINTVRMRDLMEALRLLVKEDRIAYDDDLQYYIKV